MPNNDYIKRSDALNEFHEWIVSNDGNIFSLASALEAIPAADVEPVVHCRDCKYRDQRFSVHNAICTKCYEMDCMQGYGFCSMGERMEEDDARSEKSD